MTADNNQPPACLDCSHPLQISEGPLQVLICLSCRSIKCPDHPEEDHPRVKRLVADKWDRFANHPAGLKNRAERPHLSQARDILLHALRRSLSAASVRDRQVVR